MSRPATLVSSLFLVGALLVPIAAPGEAAAAPLPQDLTANLQQPLTNVYLAQDETPQPVTPDLAYSPTSDTRVEVFSSIGNLDGDVADWRQVNEFAYLVSTVPKYQYIYATIYNTLWDFDVAKKNAAGKWAIYAKGGKALKENVFGPTIAFRDQLNQYDSDAEARKYVNTLGNKYTIDDALDAGSGLASLLVGKRKGANGANVLKLCGIGRGACLYNDPADKTEIMHSKYALFSQAKDSEGKLWDNVVWITSANLNGTSGGKKSNVGIALFGDADAYNGLLNNVWKAQVAEKQSAGYKAAAKSGVVGAKTQATYYPSPRALVSGTWLDVEADFLKSRTNAKLKGTKSECKVYVVHSLFSTARREVMNALSALKKDKCTVKIVLGENSLADIVDTYFRLSTELRALIDKVEFDNAHDKTVTISYKLNGTAYGATFAGSANLNGTSLEYDELQVKVENQALTRAVEQQSERLYQLARAGTTIKPVTKVAINPTGKLTVVMGDTLPLTATVSPSTASVKVVTWRSSDESVATVNSAGKVTPKAPGTATITATSLSGVKQATAEVAVVETGTTTPTKPATTTTLKVTKKPVLTIPPHVGAGEKASTTITWSQGQYDLNAKVTLQYYSGGKWKNYKKISLGSDGYWTGNLSFKTSHTWRVRGDSISSPKASIQSSGKYSAGYVLVAVRPKASSTTPRLYTTNLAKKDTKVPFGLQWNNPYSGKPSSLKLQYHNGKKWVTYKIEGQSTSYVTFASGAKSMVVGVRVVKTRKWRVITDARSQTKGAKTRVSKAVTVKVVK